MSGDDSGMAELQRQLAEMRKQAEAKGDAVDELKDHGGHHTGMDGRLSTLMDEMAEVRSEMAMLKKTLGAEEVLSDEELANEEKKIVGMSEGPEKDAALAAL